MQPMALRTSSLPSSTAAATPAVDWRVRVQQTVAGATTALAAGDLDRLTTAFAELAGWDDRQRAYQARCGIVEAVLSYRPASSDAWVAPFVVTAAALLDALEDEPREPVLLNHAGVFLYELLEAAAAEDLFKAALRLDPNLPFAADNLEQAKIRKRSNGRLKGAFGARMRGLAARGRKVAAQARPVPGLKLSLCMIVKDEEEMLPGCLEPLHGVVDEMIVVDTGSSDRTVEIAESFGAKVLHFPWNGSFSDARNVSIDSATGDWIMYLDADEHLEAEDAPKLRELLSRTWREGFNLVETNYTGGEDTGSATTHLALRLWRRRPEYRFEGRIHEQKTHTMPMYLPERFETTTIRVRHYGYLNQRIASKEKSQRNIQLLEQEARENPSPFNDYNLGSEYLALGDAAKARTHFDRAWESLRSVPGMASAGYVPLLVSRAARARREAGDHDAAVQAVEDGLAAYPDHTDLVMEAALSAREQGDLDRARELAERCLEMGDAPNQYAATVGSGTFLALTVLAEIHAAQGDAAGAEALYRRSLDEHPEYAGPVLPLAAILAGRGAPLAEVAEIVPDRPSARMLAATALYETGRAEDAEVWFRGVLDAQPANSAARIGLAEALLSQRRYADAAAEAAVEPADSPVRAAAVEVQVFAAAVVGDHAGLERIVSENEAALPAHEVQLFGAWAAAIRGDAPPSSVPAAAGPLAGTFLEALLRVQEIDAFAVLLGVFSVVAVDPRERHEYLATMYLRRGFLGAAADEWIAVAERAPDARAMMGLAKVAVAKGLPDDARGFAAEAVALEPRNASALSLHESIKRAFPQAA
jgi:tetratricopeptide (TPR) repeat protein